MSLGYLALPSAEYGAQAGWFRQILELVCLSAKTLHVPPLWKEKILLGSLNTKAQQGYYGMLWL